MFVRRFVSTQSLVCAVLAAFATSAHCDSDGLTKREDMAATHVSTEREREALNAAQGTGINHDMRHDDPSSVTLHLRSKEERLLNKRNLDRIKALLLRTKQRCTYSQMFNNNPCFATARFYFYLNPDPGGPIQHPQWNMNCDPTKGDFNTLVVRSRMLDEKLEGSLQYAYIDFIDANDIRVASAYGDHPSVLQLHDLVVNAVEEILAAGIVHGAIQRP